MKHDILADALNEISDRHIAEAATKKRRIRWLAPAAAVLAAIIACLAIVSPMTLQVNAVSEAAAPRVTNRPVPDDYKDRTLYLSAVDNWSRERDRRSEATTAILESLTPFFREGSAQFLTGTENVLWSPANAAIGLAMLAELTGGSSQAQLLELLGCDNLTDLRAGISALWETVYYSYKGGRESCTLANSLWLKSGLRWEEGTMDNLSYYHYASVYQGNPGSESTDRAIRQWLNENTGELLKSATDNIRLDPETVLALYSTLYIQSKWGEEFNASKNTGGTFFSPDGDRAVTFMNKPLEQMNYYWGDTFGAVCLGLKNGCRMWFLLPDEGLSPEDVVQDGEYLDMLLDTGWDQSKYMKVNLSVPKFDVSQARNLKEGLQNMGLTDIFSLETSDFSAITSATPVFITAANQAVRVQIDEQGVKAAAYIELPGAGAAAPPEEIIDFVLDRPFLFVLSNDCVPLIAGIVNEP